MADLDRNSQATNPVQLYDENTGLSAKIELIDGEPRVITGGVQSIESLKGFDEIADCWFYIGTENDDTGAGDIGDTVRVQIAAGSDSVKYPAIDFTYTLIAEDAGDEERLAINIAAALNASSPFNDLWRSQRIPNSGCVYITAKRGGSQFERPNIDDFQVSSTGNTIVNRAQQVIKRQNKQTSLARSTTDPRVGILGISGSVIQSEGEVSSRFQEVFDLKVDGSITPVEFTLPANGEVEFITSVTFGLIGNGIKWEQFFSKSALPIGMRYFFKSNDIMTSSPYLQTTEDFSDLVAEDPDNITIWVQSGGDKALVKLEFSVPLELRPIGEFSTDDYFTIQVNDNQVSGISSFRAAINGFSREF